MGLIPCGQIERMKWVRGSELGFILMRFYRLGTPELLGLYFKKIWAGNNYFLFCFLPNCHAIIKTSWLSSTQGGFGVKLYTFLNSFTLGDFHGNNKRLTARNYDESQVWSPSGDVWTRGTGAWCGWRVSLCCIRAASCPGKQPGVPIINCDGGENYWLETFNLYTNYL